MEDLKELVLLLSIGGLMAVMALVDTLHDKLGSKENRHDK